MRKIQLLLILIASIFSIGLAIWEDTYAGSIDCQYWALSNTDCLSSDIPYCDGSDDNCSLNWWLQRTDQALGNNITNQPLSAFVGDIVLYFLSFVSLIAVAYILYAWFRIMTSGGDEESTKKAKNIILYVFIGIVLMWLAYAIVNIIVWILSDRQRADIWQRAQTAYRWNLIPDAQAATYSESGNDTFREYQNKLRIAIQDLESELKINKKVNVSNLQNLKNLVQGAYDRLPDFGDDGTKNDTMKRGVDREIDIAINNPTSVSQVSSAISIVASFINDARIGTVEWSITASPGQGNAPLTVSFEATGIKDPSGTSPDQMNYIWWMRENGGVRRELGRGKSLVHTFTQEWNFTVFLDVISGSRNSKKKIDVLPLTTSTTVEVKPRLGDVVLLINGVNVSNIDTIKINPTIGKMGVILDATASRATGGNIIETSWDFGNGNTITYEGRPIVERQIFATEWDYMLKLELKANNGQSFTKNIRLIVRDPSAVIQTDKVVGNIWDDMFFSAVSYFTNTKNVEYSWQIQDDNNKKIASNLPGASLRFKFDKVWNYIVTLNARSPNGEIDTDSRQITIESRSPVVNLDAPKPQSTETPNVLVFDASKSYDPDTMGRKWLTYTWRLDGQRVDLENTTSDGAKWTIKFDAVGNHTIAVTVANQYGKVTTVERNFDVTSILSANMLITPRVAPLGTIVNFVAQSENGDFFEWNMGDGSPAKTGNKRIVQHMYQKTGIYEVTLTVSSAKWTETNQIKRRVYVTDTNSPFSMIGISNASSTAYYDAAACSGSGAMVVNRSEITNFDGTKSINIDGNTTDLTYTWNYFGKVKTTPTLSEKLNEIGCYPIKLTVRSNKNGATHTSTEYVAIKNLPPELTSISTSIDTTKKDNQKVLVRVAANWVSDPDGVITSYIWYYTTESDREPQNIQITQKPEITFVLPNITEKYYFGVILEDNDGARTNSMEDGSEQVPLILDNQNGNIYMPLITLSMPKNAVLVGDNVFMNVEAKTILGTNITKNAEYAWDFDGDGRFDERSNNPSVNHTYKKPGTYSMKVRVTYNGVSNTKYGTIYVKNPLKADAVWYELKDGSIYFMNTSEWIYDRALWTINGEQTESPYTLTIPRAALSFLTGETLGTLRVSNGESETSVFTLSRSWLISLGTQTWVLYQTSPREVDGSVHIKWQSDRFALSLIGNSATEYAIDSDTRIDSDLDGTPDNDVDNRNHSSYTDGGTFVISDFAESRERSRTVRITLRSGGTVVGTKDISLTLDFVPDSNPTDNDLIATDSGSMNTFDKGKLDELAALIRTTDGADRVVLMQKYNIMIENWGDSFSKAKSLIDIQEALETTTLPEDKKAAITSIIDALLVGDAIATDEVTLATKLIQDLIPESSTNRATILDKLTEISSHPNDIEKNRVLGKEILELVKNDATIEDKYKIHIKNQLLVIINGGQNSIPTEEVEEESSAGSGILGFVSGVVWIFFYTIWAILIILLIGYIFYRLSRKSEDIGFQDFLIDSVFHSNRDGANKTETTVIVDSSTPVIVPEKKEVIDPLASYTPPTPIVTPISVAAEPIIPQEEATIPTWLQAPKMPEPAVEPTIVDTPTPITDAVAAVSTTEDNVPDWLKEAESETKEILWEEKPDTTIDSPVTEEVPVVTPMTTEEANTGSSNLPDWLSAGTTPTEEVASPLEPINTDTTTVESGNSSDILPTSSPEASSDALPDWLVESLKTDEKPAETVTTTEPKTETKKKKTTKKKEEWTGSIEPTGANSSDIPDWLK